MRFSTFAICSVEMRRVDVVSSSPFVPPLPLLQRELCCCALEFLCVAHLSELLLLQYRLKLDLRALNHTCCFLTSLLILKSLKIVKSFIHYAHKTNFGSDKFLYSASE